MSSFSFPVFESERSLKATECDCSFSVSECRYSSTVSACHIYLLKLIYHKACFFQKYFEPIGTNIIDARLHETSHLFESVHV